MNTSSRNNSINVNMSNINTVRNISYYNNKIDHNLKRYPYYNYNDDNPMPTQTKFSYFMDLYGRTIFSPYEIIYFFIYHDYIDNKYDESHLTYIYQ